MNPNEVGEQQETLYRNGTYRFQPLVNVLAVIAAPILLWVMLQVVTLSEFRAATEANRFTSKDGTAVWKKLADIESNMPKEIPPEWFLREVRLLEKRITTIEERHQSEDWHPGKG